jgi:hypothetical protein
VIIVITWTHCNFWIKGQQVPTNESLNVGILHLLLLTKPWQPSSESI